MSYYRWKFVKPTMSVLCFEENHLLVVVIYDICAHVCLKTSVLFESLNIMCDKRNKCSISNFTKKKQQKMKQAILMERTCEFLHHEVCTVLPLKALFTIRAYRFYLKKNTYRYIIAIFYDLYFLLHFGQLK